MGLKNIDFSNGIRSESIQYNFNYLQDEINYDRSFLVGYGIADGLTINVDESNYIINVSKGSIINKDGSRVDINDFTYNINLSNDILQTIVRDHIVTNGEIQLLDVPYAYDGKSIAALSSDYKNDITIESILGVAITDFSIDQTSQGNTILIPGAVDNTLYRTQYYIAKDIIYTIYINKDNTVQICKSIASTSPSIYELEGAKYKLGDVTIRTNIDGYTKVYKSADMADRINVYTNEDNELYINGELYGANVKIYTSMPTNPKEYDILYNGEHGVNQLYVYRQNEDGSYEWRAIGDAKFSLTKTSKLWNPCDTLTYNSDYLNSNYFLFSYEEQGMYYEPNSNALSVIVDNTLLHKDQYVEIKASDIKDILEKNEDISLINVIKNLGYTIENLNSLIYIMDRSGNILGDRPDVCIGFYLSVPLNYAFNLEGYQRGAYVEALVTHMFNTPAATTKIQKTTSFIYEKNIVYDNSLYIDTVFSTDRTYKYGENQLEVYLNGIRLSRDIDYVENRGIDSAANRFTVTHSLTNGDIITYRINSTVYKYDNDFTDNIPKGTFSFVVTRDTSSDVIKIPEPYGIGINDYINIYTCNDRKILFGSLAYPSDAISTDYSLVDNDGVTEIHLLNTSLVPIGESLYVTGIKF